MSWGLVFLLGVLAVTVTARLRLLEVPLERDEGEFAYQAWLMLEGEAPYRSAYAMKWPGIYVMYIVFMTVFEPSPKGIHLGLLCCNVASILLVYLLVRRSHGDVIGALSAAFFAYLSFTPVTLGTTTQAEPVLLPMVLGGAWFILRFLDRRRSLDLILGALLLGAAMTVKQHGVLLVAAVVVYFAIQEVRRWQQGLGLAWPGLVALPLLMAVPLVGMMAAMWSCDVFPQFWFWTVTYASDYVSQTTPRGAWHYLSQVAFRLFRESKLLWVLSAWGLISLAWNRGTRQSVGLWIAFLVGGILAAVPGFYFRPHYFAFLLPAVAFSRQSG